MRKYATQLGEGRALSSTVITILRIVVCVLDKMAL